MGHKGESRYTRPSQKGSRSAQDDDPPDDTLTNGALEHKFIFDAVTSYIDVERSRLERALSLLGGQVLISEREDELPFEVNSSYLLTRRNCSEPTRHI